MVLAFNPHRTLFEAVDAEIRPAMVDSPSPCSIRRFRFHSCAIRGDRVLLDRCAWRELERHGVTLPGPCRRRCWRCAGGTANRDRWSHVGAYKERSSRPLVSRQDYRAFACGDRCRVHVHVSLLRCVHRTRPLRTALAQHSRRRASWAVSCPPTKPSRTEELDYERKFATTCFGTA